MAAARCARGIARVSDRIDAAEVKTLPQIDTPREDVSTRPAPLLCGIRRRSEWNGMGTLVYDRDRSAEFDDRTLAHLQVIVVNKLRRQESFAFTWSDEVRTVTVWISPHTPLEFVFHGNRRPRLNRAWLEELALAASSTSGLVVLPEPPEDIPALEDDLTPA